MGVSSGRVALLRSNTDLISYLTSVVSLKEVKTFLWYERRHKLVYTAV